MISFFATVLGASILTGSLLIGKQITKLLPDGSEIRRKWLAMAGLVCFFIVGYLSYLVFLLSKKDAESEHLIVSLVFFFGSIFVLLSAKTALETIRDIRNASKLKRESSTDPLTGIFNRRYFFRNLRKRIQKLNPEEHSLSIALIDIDNFKVVNDRFGHLVGDKVLISVCETISRNIRKRDLIGRYGGDEFLIALFDVGPKKAKGVIERIRLEIESKEVPINEKLKLKVTVSAGLSSGPCPDVTALEAFVKKADVNLYKAKRDGKNKVVIEEDPFS